MSKKVECREEGSIAPFGSPGHDAYSLAAFNSQRPRWMIDHETFIGLGLGLGLGLWLGLALGLGLGLGLGLAGY